jgi:hypothetical protein
VSLTRDQALAFRLTRQHLHERLPAGEAGAAAVVGLQDTPPGAAGLALAARVTGATPAELESLVIVQSVRGAPMAVAVADLPLFTTALAPPDEAAARALIMTAARTLDGITAMDALDRVSEAVGAVLADGPLGRDAFHQALRERLPDELLWWCRGCGSRHVHPSLWRATGARGVLAIVGREARGAAIFGLPPEAPAMEDPGAALARRFLHGYGPATPRLFAQWTGLGAAHAKALWQRAGELAEVDLDGRRSWLLAEDAGALTGTPAVRGVRLVTGLDPLLGARDREVLVPDPDARRRVWRGLANPGAVLVDGEVAGLWRASRKGSALIVTVEALGPAVAGRAGELEAEAQTLAPWRGAERADVVLA